MGSTRLLGKVLRKLDNNKRVLDLQIERLKLSKQANSIILAISSKKENKPLVELAKSHKVLIFKGSEENVLKRFYQAAKKFIIDTIVRITSDCPFVDPKIIDDLWLAIDEKEDLILCREIYKRLKEKGKSINFSLYNILDLIEKNPELIEINKNHTRNLI